MSHQPAKRTPWLDEKGETVIIDDHARELGTFVEAMADGRIEPHELEKAEARLVALLKKIEPTLNDEQHELVTRLLVEISAFSIMQTLSEIEAQQVRRLVL